MNIHGYDIQWIVKEIRDIISDVGQVVLAGSHHYSKEVIQRNGSAQVAGKNIEVVFQYPKITTNDNRVLVIFIIMNMS